MLKNKPTVLLLLLASFSLAGCGSIFSDKEVAEETEPLIDTSGVFNSADFTKAFKSSDNALAKPPNIISEVDLALLQLDKQGIDRLLPDITQARLQREGSVYWLEVDLDTEQVWPLVRDFWLEQGFALETEIPEIGIIETDWKQDRSRVFGTGLTSFLDVALERLHDTGERYQFRSRIERGTSSGTTEIYISYRAFAELSNNNFHILPKDITLEAEMLRRMLLKFRLPEESIAILEQATLFTPDTNSLYTINDNTLIIHKGRDNAWRRILLGLDRSGFTIVANDKVSGEITILIANSTPKKTEKQGFFGNLFNKNKPKGKSFEVKLEIVKSANDRTTLKVPAGELGNNILQVLSQNI